MTVATLRVAQTIFSHSLKEKPNLDLLCSFKITLNFGKHIVSPHLARNIWNHLAHSYCPPIVFGFNPSSLDYVTSVDLWSDIIAMEYPSQHILCLLKALFLCKMKRQ